MPDYLRWRVRVGMYFLAINLLARQLYHLVL